jgi:hypothetical protein
MGTDDMELDIDMYLWETDGMLPPAFDLSAEVPFPDPDGASIAGGAAAVASAAAPGAPAGTGQAGAEERVAPRTAGEALAEGGRVARLAIDGEAHASLALLRRRHRHTAVRALVGRAARVGTIAHPGELVVDLGAGAAVVVLPGAARERRAEAGAAAAEEAGHEP